MVDRLLTAYETASRLSLSPRTLQRRQDELPPVRLSRKIVRYRESDVQSYIARGGGSAPRGKRPRRPRGDD